MQDFYLLQFFFTVVLLLLLLPLLPYCDSSGTNMFTFTQNAADVSGAKGTYSCWFAF